MTKRDLKSLVVNGTIGLGALFALWYWARRTRTITEVNPVMIKWESH